jgi:hypothetical protein
MDFNGPKAVSTIQLKPVTEPELDVNYSIGLLESWFGDDQKLPALVKMQLLGHVKTITEGVRLYREKYLQIQDELRQLQVNYNNLAGLSASYLQEMQRMKEDADQRLIDEQKPFHEGRYIDILET